MDEITWQSTIYSIVVHPTDAGVFVLREPDRQVLPHVILPKPIWRADIQTVGQELKQALPFDFNVLRYIAHHRSTQTRRIQVAYLLEVSGDLPEDAVWSSPEDLLTQGLLPEDLQHEISIWLEERKTGIIPELRPPWAKPGWYPDAVAWIGEQILLRTGETVISIETIKSWGISCVMRASTNRAKYYFKASKPLPLFVAEGPLTLFLAEIFPDYVTRPLALDIPRRWMLVEEEGDSLPWSPPFETHSDLYAALARIQTGSIHHLPALLDAGCLDRRLSHLHRSLPQLVEDDLILARLKVEERTRLRQFVPTFQNLIEQLDSLGMPDTLIHGDFHTGNIVRAGDSYRVFDWSDASIGHPFMDLLTLGDQTNHARRMVVRNAYLEPWLAFAPLDLITQAFDLAQVIYPLHHAISYQAILHNIEPSSRSELDAAPELLRSAMQNLTDYNKNLMAAG